MDVRIFPAKGSSRSRTGVPADLDLTLDQVNQPELRNSRAGIQTPLGVPVVIEGGRRHFHDEHRHRGSRVRLQEIAWRSANHSNVGIRLGTKVQRKRKLRPDVECLAERLPQCFMGKLDADGVPGPLRRHGDNLSFDQFHTLARCENAMLCHAVISFPRPSVRFEFSHKRNYTCIVSRPRPEFHSFSSRLRAFVVNWGLALPRRREDAKNRQVFGFFLEGWRLVDASRQA